MGKFSKEYSEFIRSTGLVAERIAALGALATSVPKRPYAAVVAEGSSSGRPGVSVTQSLRVSVLPAPYPDASAVGLPQGTSAPPKAAPKTLTQALVPPPASRRAAPPPGLPEERAHQIKT